MKRPFFIYISGIWFLASGLSHAILDTNQNGLSDFWEREQNDGELFPAAFDPQADPDGDGWTNSLEALAGTNPFSPNAPGGIIAPTTTQTPAVYGEPDANGVPVVITPLAITISWPTLIGKQYTVFLSPNLEQGSWLPIGSPFLADGGVATYGFEISGLDKSFWRVAVEDYDSDNDGLTDHEETSAGTNPSLADSDGDGLPDRWEMLNNLDANNSGDAALDSNGDGITNLQAFALGIDPAEYVGPVNLGFDEDMSGEFPDLSFREETPSDLYDQSSVPGWQADIGQHIEIWEEDNGNTYLELQSHLDAHGVKQEFKMLPGTRLDFIVRYKGRYYYGDYDNAFDLKVEGASELLVDGAPVSESGSARSHTFMEDDDWEQWTEWQYAAVSISTDPDASGLVEVTLSLVPKETTSSEEEITYGGLVDLLPVEVAPDVLAVNSDFDEGRIDPATGYAIPDCDDMPGVDLKTGAGNTKLELGAQRNHLDGTFTQGQHVVDDLHKGWFGVNPNSLGDDFWAGANVTIRKIDKIDDDTGYKESGQVRFYAKWDGGYCGIAPYDFQTLQPVNLVSAGVNLRPNEGVYGASSTIPDGAEFYMEGVRPGKITLEWRLQKGSIDVKHEQTFKVVTQKTRDEWRDELRYQVRLQSSVAGEEIDLNNFNPTAEFTSNTKFLKATYGWYEQNFVQSEDKLIWAGMAKMAGAPVYAALSDAQVGRALGPGIGVELTARQLQRALMKGNKDIFLDLAWQHRAYAASGILALRFVDNNDESVGLRAVQLTDWILIDKGFWQNSLFKSSLGARELLRREQRFIIESVYSEIVALALDEIISVLAKNPIPNLPPLGKPFAEVVQVGNLAVFDDRWRWIKSDMYPGWTGIGELSMDLGVELGGGSGGYSESDRLNYSQIGLSSRARNYATFPNSVP